MLTTMKDLISYKMLYNYQIHVSEKKSLKFLQVYPDDLENILPAKRTRFVDMIISLKKVNPFVEIGFLGLNMYQSLTKNNLKEAFLNVDIASLEFICVFL